MFGTNFFLYGLHIVFELLMLLMFSWFVTVSAGIICEVILLMIFGVFRLINNGSNASHKFILLCLMLGLLSASYGTNFFLHRSHALLMNMLSRMIDDLIKCVLF